MAWALFENTTQMSKTFPTRAACWAAAKDSGLVVDNVSDTDGKVHPELEDDYEIKEVGEASEDAVVEHLHENSDFAPAGKVASRGR